MGDGESGTELAGRVVLVTGGTRGVGRGIAASFAAAGATVLICGRSDPGDGAPGEFVACDVREPDAVASMVETVLSRHGRLDVAVNNAGGSPPADAATASPRFSEAIIRLNLTGALHVAQAANRVMQTQEHGGVIINIGSLSALRPSPNTAAYGAAKAGLLSLTQSLAMEWAPKVRVNAVTPGPVLTEQAALFYGDEAGVDRVAQTIPLGRLAEPGDVGDACVLLCSPLAAYVTGANLLVHGGGERPPYIEAAGG